NAQPQRAENPANGSWRIVQVLPTTHNLSEPRIPPTAVGGLFKSFLQRTTSASRESRQRQLADCSSPSYNAQPQRAENPANGSWRIVQVLPTTHNLSEPRIPPTAVGGLFKSFLQRTTSASRESRQRQLADCSSPSYNAQPQRAENPANGSWRIVQVRTIHQQRRCNINSEDLKYPPTAVAGIRNMVWDEGVERT